MNLDSSFSNTVNPLYGLYPYQSQVLADILHALITPPDELVRTSRRAIAHLPTGAGKTRIAAHAACYLLNNANDDALMVWLASTEELCTQASDELARAWGFLGRREAMVHRYWGTMSPNLGSLGGGFLIAGLAKLWAADNRDPQVLAGLARRTALVVFDEAHQSTAETYEYLAEQLTAHQPPLLGLTATPGRGWGLSDEDERLAELFRYNRVSIDPRGHASPVEYLIENGYLADPRFFHVDFESEVAEGTGKNDYDSSILEVLGDDQQRNDRIVELVDRELDRSRRIIAFCPSVASAITCSERLSSKSRKSEVITAGTPDNERRRVIAEFKDKNGPPTALFNFGVLTAGFDAPATRCVVIARPTRSVILFSQMAGRALRGPKSGGNPTCQIYTVVDTGLPGFRSVADAFSNWEALWS